MQSAIKEMRVSRKRFSEQDIWLILTQGLLVLCELEKYSVVHCNILSHRSEDAQYMVCAAADFFYPVCAPSPDGRADEMYGLDAVGF